MIQLGEWLKQIILIVILAVLTDLLLPTKAMQKYVRTVMGLVVIAAILQPIIPLFQRDWADHLSAMVASEVASSSNNSTTNTSNTDLLPGLSGYEADLQQQQAKTEDKYIALQLRSLINGQFHDTVSQVAVTGASKGTAGLQVSVSVLTMDPSELADIRKFVATNLQISLTQVSVQSE